MGINDKLEKLVKKPEASEKDNIIKMPVKEEIKAITKEKLAEFMKDMFRNTHRVADGLTKDIAILTNMDFQDKEMKAVADAVVHLLMINYVVAKDSGFMNTIRGVVKSLGVSEDEIRLMIEEVYLEQQKQQ